MNYESLLFDNIININSYKNKYLYSLVFNTNFNKINIEDYNIQDISLTVYTYNYFKMTFYGLIKILFDPGDGALYRFVTGDINNSGRLINSLNLPIIEFIKYLLGYNLFSTILLLFGLFFNVLLYYLIIRNIILIDKAHIFIIFIILTILYFILIPSGPEAQGRFRVVVMPALLILAVIKKNRG